MKKAILITGFSHWGKSTIIRKLFYDRYKFYFDYEYTMKGLNNIYFTVQSQSNDDLDIDKFIEYLKDRIKKTGSHGENLLAAFCPTIPDENGYNDSRKAIEFLLQNNYEVHIFYLKYRWDKHAALKIDNIFNFYKKYKNLNHVIIKSTDLKSKVLEITKCVTQII